MTRRPPRLGLALAGLLAACADDPTQHRSFANPADGPANPRYATLVGIAPVRDRLLGGPLESLVFTRIDSTRTAFSGLARVSVSPGEHDIEFSYANRDGERRTEQLTLYAEPMAVYDVRRVVHGYLVTFEAVRRP